MELHNKFCPNAQDSDCASTFNGIFLLAVERELKYQDELRSHSIS
jgi:hypothetical protein